MLLMLYKDIKGNRKWIKANDKSNLEKFIEEEKNNIDEFEIEIFEIHRGKIDYVIN